jgi:two-component system, NtrC family, sensor kinase
MPGNASSRCSSEPGGTDMSNDAVTTRPGTDQELATVVNADRLATLGMLMAGIAHEINTPLGALASNHDVVKRALSRLHDILEDDVVDEYELVEVRKIVKALNGTLRVNDLAVERVLELVGSLRSFGRPDRAEVDRADVVEGIDTALTLLRHKIGDGITVERDFEELPEIECFPVEVNQLFMNLLLNAVQAIEGHGDGRGTVTIRGRNREGGIVLEVEDDGPGMSSEVRQRIFEPGFTTKGARVGMGLGLIIVRQILDRHGGTIDVESEPGKGSRFSVFLPLSLPPAVGNP